MTAELLREAAALMRERAAEATAGPWETYRTMQDETFVSEVDRRGFGVISGPATGRDDYGRGNAEHIASWHPAVALAVADWLDSVAERQKPTERYNRRSHGWTGSRQANAVARAYLGTTP